MLRRTGFTLLEVLLVIVLIGILASVVVVNFSGDSAEEQVNKEANRFQQVFQFIAETAQLRQQEWGLVASETGYGFVYFSDNQWQWVDEPEAAQEHKLPAGMRLQLELEGLPGAEQNLLSAIDWQLAEPDDASDNAAVPPPLPSVFLLSSGEITPFRLQFSLSEGVDAFQVSVGTDFSIPLRRYSMDNN